MTFRARQMTSFMFSSRGGGDGKTERKVFGLIHIGVRRQEKRKLESFCYLVINPPLRFRGARKEQENRKGLIM